MEVASDCRIRAAISETKARSFCGRKHPSRDVISPGQLKFASNTMFSGPQKGPAERGHVKKRQKSSKSVKNIFVTFRHFSRRTKNVKNRQKVSKVFSTLFDYFRAAPVFWPFLGGSDMCFLTVSSRPCLETSPHSILRTPFPGQCLDAI